MSYCDIVNQIGDEAYKNLTDTYELDVDDAITNFIGNEKDAKSYYNAIGGKLGKVAAQAYDDLRVSIKKQIMDNAGIVGSAYKPQERIEQLQDFVQQYFKTSTLFDPRKRFVSPRRIIAANKLIKKLINLQNTRWGKKLNIWERAFLPTTMFAMRFDPFGIVYKFSQSATTLLEDSRRNSSKYKAQYDNINRGLFNSIANIVQSHTDQFGPEWTMDGVNLTDTDGNKLIFYGTVEGEDGFYYHRVRDVKTDQIKNIPINKLSTSSIQNAIIDKYVYRFMNDLMHGQTRYIEWRDRPTELHKAKIDEILAKWGTLKGSNETKKGIPEIHEFKSRGGTRFKYVLIHERGVIDDLGNMTERSYGYIIQHEDQNGVHNYFGFGAEQGNYSVNRGILKTELRNGFYKSNKFKTYARKKRMNGEFTDYNERGWDFSGINALYLNQPKPELLVGNNAIQNVQGEERIKFSSMWESLEKMRNMYDSIGRDIVNIAEAEEKDIRKWFNTTKSGQSRASMALKSLLGDEAKTQDAMNVIKDLFSINSRIWIDKFGNAHTPNSSFVKYQDFYAPTMFDDGVALRMIEQSIKDMENREVKTPEEREELDNKILEFQLMYARATNNRELQENLETQLGLDPSNTSRATIADRNVHTKHRSEWTDPNQRRTDPNVHGEYLNSVYYSLQKNRLMLHMLEALENVNKYGNADKSIVDWIINRTRIAMADPLAKAGIGNVDMSYQRLAEILNKLPGNKKWDAESAQRWITGTKGMLSAALLGSSGAMTNRTQIVNPIIGMGIRFYKQSAAILAGKGGSENSREIWDAIIDHAGTDEVTNMFMDVMAHGGDLSLKDAGLITVPGLNIQVPTKAFLAYLKQGALGRKSFIENGIKEIDIGLRKMQIDEDTNIQRRQEAKRQEVLANAKGYNKTKIESILRTIDAEEKRLLSDNEKRNIQYLREAFLDLITTKKGDNNAKMLEGKFKKLMGEVSENRLRRMIAWKLSWWFDDFAPELFTFTEGERYMRRQTVIMSLLYAKEMGQLGGDRGTTPVTFTRYVKDDNGNDIPQEVSVKVPNIYLSDSAIRIARNSVANTMFGMSPIHLGEAFTGMGAHFGLYKAYPLQQMLHDKRVWDTFHAGNVSTVETITRITNALADATKRAWKGQQYSPDNTELDHEALAMLRLIGTRVTMSVFSVAVEALGILKYLGGSTLYKQMSLSIRGGENPALAIAFRVLTNMAIYAMADDDKKADDGMVRISWDIIRLFLPVFLTLPANVLYNLIED